MIKLLLLILSSVQLIVALDIIQKPIVFTPHRKALTLEYIKSHYALEPQDITITPQVILVHYTAIATLKGSFNAFNPEVLPQSRKDIAQANESVNVSVAYLVDRDGTIYQLMPDYWMARHVIGLNYSSIGIENVGKLGNLTEAQRQANSALIHYLQKKYPTIKYLVAHSEYRCFEKTPLWLEKDKNYRTHKEDPGKSFMQKLRLDTPSLLKAPCP